MPGKQTVWVGADASPGIDVLEWESGQWRMAARGGPDRATYLARAEDGVVLAGVETDAYDGVPGGAVAACRLENGAVRVCAAAVGLGRGVCHVTWDSENRRVFAAGYPDGGVDVLTWERGALSAQRRLPGAGRGPKPEQEGPHAHCTLLDARENVLYVCDLGADKIARYAGDTLRALEPFCLPAGSGPRHMVQSGDGALLYIACELSGEVLAVRSQDGAVLQRVNCRPAAEGFCALSSIRFMPGSRALAVGCRAQDGVWLLPVRKDGRLETPSFFASASRWPWDVAPLEDGLLAAAFAESGCVEAGRCVKGLWQTVARIAIERPRSLLCFSKNQRPLQAAP